MAFFMALWLVNSAAIPVRERIASYFRAPGIFKKVLELRLKWEEQEYYLIHSRHLQTKTLRFSLVGLVDTLLDDGKQREVLGEGGGVSTKQGKIEKDKFEKIAEEIKATLEKTRLK